MTDKKSNKIQKIKINTTNNSIILQNRRHLKKNTKKNLVIIHPIKDRTRFLQILSKKIAELWINRYFYHKNTIQNPTHLVLKYSEYRADRVETFEKLDNDQKSIEYLFNTRIDREKLFKFLEKTKIASKKWLLGSN